MKKYKLISNNLIQQMDNDKNSYTQLTESQSESPLALLKYPDKFKQNFYQSAKKSILLLQTEEYEEAILYLNKSLDLLNVQLGKQVLGASPYWRLCLYGNFACGYQRLWQIQRCCKYCEKVQSQLGKFFNEQHRKEHKLYLLKELIKVKFQKCALLSQSHKHDHAIQVCKSIFPLLQNFLIIISSYIETKLKNEKIKKPSDNISFIEQICQFSQIINKNLVKTLKEPLSNHNKKQTFYFWSKNPEKNEEQILKKFVGGKENEKWKKSILGVTKSKNWVGQFNIGTVMHISQFFVERFEKPIPLEQYVFKQNIYESIIYCSLVHFTLATQIRFIQFNRQKSAIQEKKQKIREINKRYGYDQKSEQFFLSQLHHLKAIDIIAKNVQFNIPYLSHIVRSYEKHYINEKPLDRISSIAQESGFSATLLKSERNMPTSEVRQNLQYVQNENIQPTQKNMQKKKKLDFSPLLENKEKKSSLGRTVKKNQPLFIRIESQKSLSQLRSERGNKSFVNVKGRNRKELSQLKEKTKKSSEDKSGRKRRKKSPQKHISIFETYGKSNPKDKGQSATKKGSSSNKKIVFMKLV